MKKIIYLLLLSGSVVLVSVRGGTIAWILFYFMLAIPVLALLYVWYVYCRFRIGQRVARYVEKGKAISYSLKLANEDWLIMTGIRLNFYTDTVAVMKKNSEGVPVPYEQEQDALFLLPHESKEAELELSCKYRGTYFVGVKSVSITDFFGLFTIVCPIRTHVRVTARPRLLTLTELQSKLKANDSKKSRSASTLLQEQPDFELRKYIQGDSLRRIHWKNSARAGELLVRKQSPLELYELVVVMDCTFLKQENELQRMQIEDNIIETALALLYDACLKKVKTRVVWYSDRLCEMAIDNMKSFERFYKLSAELLFSSKLTLEEVWKACEAKMPGNSAFRLIGCDVPPELSQAVDKSCRQGKEIILIDTGKEPL